MFSGWSWFRFGVRAIYGTAQCSLNRSFTLTSLVRIVNDHSYFYAYMWSCFYNDSAALGGPWSRGSSAITCRCIVHEKRSCLNHLVNP